MVYIEHATQSVRWSQPVFGKRFQRARFNALVLAQVFVMVVTDLNDNCGLAITDPI